MKERLLRLRNWLIRAGLRLIGPTRTELIDAIVAGTSGLELAKGDSRKLPAFKDETFGPFVIEGNALPKFTYRVFDDALMEFVLVTVHVARPSKMEFVATTEDLGDVSAKPAYCAPFMRLAHHLYNYFPLYTESKDVRVIDSKAV